jgi:hypothetical protein
LTAIQKLQIEWYSRNVSVHASPIFILGNQKSGTSAIAALLGRITGLSVTIDLKKEYLSARQSYYRVLKGERDFQKLIERNRLDFSRDIIKEANLTLFFDEILAHFPESRFVFVLRDPRENIRSILNRLDIPGHLSSLNQEHKKKIPIGWSMVLNGSWLGLKGDNYIEMMAARWNLMSDVYLKNKGTMIMIRYEDFLKDKVGEISKLAKALAQVPVNDISDRVDIQYQPRGMHGVSWESFFGSENLSRIERICAKQMDFFGYKRVCYGVKAPEVRE